jgi:hypothetical protein
VSLFSLFSSTHHREKHCPITHKRFPRPKSKIPSDEQEEQSVTKTYNIRDSPVVTHPSTSLTITGLSMGERTGSRILRYLWSYVTEVGNYLLFSLSLALPV